MTMRAIAVACSTFVLALSVAVTAEAQSQARSDVASTTMEEVLAELRALRAEMNRAAAAGLRAQLLVARLVLQEQRLASIGRELTDVQEKLQANDRTRPVANMLQSIGKEPEETRPGQSPEPNFFLDMIRGQAAELEKSDQQLKDRYGELSRLLADEQARWTSFNAQLEALEKAWGK